MRSVRFVGNSGVEMVDVAEPAPGPDEVTVRTIHSALCGSELHCYREHGAENGNSGHEGLGRVVELGKNVKHLRVGDRVGVSAVAGCGDATCAYCARGQSTYCPKFKVTSSMHAEYFKAPARSCLPIPDDIPDDAAVLLSGDGFGVPYHTSRKTLEADVRTVAIFGMGPVGLGNAMMQAHMGREVIAVDLSPYRLDYAKKLGAAHSINVKDGDAVEAIRQFTGGRGADVCIEAAGRPDTLKQCFAAVRTAGKVVINGEQQSVQLSPSNDFIRRDITAVGSWFFQIGEFDQMVDTYRKGLDVRKLVSHVLPGEDAAEAFETFAAGKSAKVLLDWNA